MKYPTSGANPSYTPTELAYQISTTKAALLVVHPGVLEGALVAAEKAGIPSDRIIPLDTLDGRGQSTVAPDLNELIAFGLAHPPNFVERRLNPGEGKTKVAFLSFSSGTTGKPKVSMNLNSTRQRPNSLSGGRDTPLCPYREHDPNGHLVGCQG
jgi:4-coumarate--CoA ligase